MGVSHKGAISLGLLYIPVGLYTTTRDNDLKFNQLCIDTKERVKYKKYCPSCNKEIKPDGIIKGYEYEDGRYVTMTEEELEKIKSKKDKTIHIIQFVQLSEIDSIYYERNYYVKPETGAEKAYELLRNAMLSEQKVALAKTVIGTKKKTISTSPFSVTPPGNESAVWLIPELVCVVQYMPNEKGSLRQPVFKGFRNDKTAKDCQIDS